MVGEAKRRLEEAQANDPGHGLVSEEFLRPWQAGDNLLRCDEPMPFLSGHIADSSVELRKWAFEQAMRIYPGADEDVAIESADAILAWVTKRGAAHG